jgi:hypothetical protein
MMKKKLRGYGLSINGASTGALLIFLVLCLGTGFDIISSLPGPVDRFAAVGELGGQKAFAGEQGIKEAMVDSNLYNDTLIVVDTTAAPGSSFWLTVNLTNKTIPVTGFGFLLTYKPSIIYPETVWTNPCTDSLCTLIVIRGYKTERTEGPFTDPFVWGGRTENNHIDTLRFNALTDIFADPVPHLPNPGSGPVVRFKFFVRPDAAPGVKDTIRFLYWDPALPPPGNYANTLTDILGEHNFIPRTKNGILPSLPEGGRGRITVRFSLPPRRSLFL